MEAEQPQVIAYVNHHLEVTGQTAILASMVLGTKMFSSFKFQISTFIFSCLYGQ